MSEEKETVENMGTEFDPEVQELGDWFSYFGSHIDDDTKKLVYEDPKPGAAKIRIRNIANFIEEATKGRQKEHSMVLNRATRSMERVTWFKDLSPEEDQKMSDDAWDYAITEWEGVIIKGERIPCTKENKLRLLKIPSFVRFCNRAFQILSEVVEKDEKEKVKN